MKKFLSLLLAMLMMISCVSMIAAEDTAITDEAETTEAEVTPYDFAIEFLTEYGIYKGGEPALADIQRYQMALFVARIATGWTDDDTWEDGTLNSSEFVDIDTDPANLYLGAISYANQKGIIEGYGDGNFGPYDGIIYQDALTMLVRVLGWNNLKYPWGNIEQAIKLGLTDGITGVAYTDVLTRAEVAQLVYNALFIEGKNGTVLANTNFEIQDGWQTVIITGSNLGTYGSVGSKVGYGQVGFSILNADGSIGATQYVGSAADFGMDASTNDPTTHIGHVYKVIFTANDRNIAKVKFAKSLYLDTVWANGQTDDEGNAQKNAVSAFIAEQKVVSKYSDTDSYYYGENYADDEFILVSAEKTWWDVTTVEDSWMPEYAVDWETGNIVKLTYGYNQWANPQYRIDGEEIIWYYHSELNAYFKKVFYDYRHEGWNDVYENVSGKDYAIHWMSEEEFAGLGELLQSFVQQVITRRYTGRYHEFTLGDLKYESAYASLELFDTNEDGVADRGYYERYGFGQILFSTRMCRTYESHRYTACGQTVNVLMFKNVGAEPSRRLNPDNLSGAYFANWNNSNVDTGYGEAGADGTGYDAPSYWGDYSFVYDMSAPCSGHITTEQSFNGLNTSRPEWMDYTDGMHDTAERDIAPLWFNKDYAVTENCVGMWRVDDETGEVKVIKTVEDKDVTTDVDTFTSKGIVRAWSSTNGSVTIVDEDGTQATYRTSYPTLFRYERNWSAGWEYYVSIFADRMEELFMNYVNYMVVDGVLVSIALDGNDTENVIVVDEYLGINSETGLITVAGYYTNSLTRKEFQLLSVEGWISGDWYNTMNSYVLEAMQKTFTMGAILKINSKDKETGAYNVTIAGEYDNNGNFVVDTNYGLNNAQITLDFTGATHDYYFKNGSLTTGASKVEIVVIRPNTNPATSTIAKFDDFGAGKEGWKITGIKINKDANRHVIVATSIENGFEQVGGAKVSLVQIKGLAGADRVEYTSRGSYIVGSTKTTFAVLDFSTGETTYATATNKKLVDGGLYVTHDGVIVSTLEEAMGSNNIIGFLEDVFGNGATYGDGNEWYFGKMPDKYTPYTKNLILEQVIPNYAARELAEIDTLYAGNDSVRNAVRNAFISSLITGNNEYGVKLYDTKYDAASNQRVIKFNQGPDGLITEWRYYNGSANVTGVYGLGGVVECWFGGPDNSIYRPWSMTSIDCGCDNHADIRYLINTKTGSCIIFINVNNHVANC